MWMIGTCASASFAETVPRQLLDQPLGRAAPRFHLLAQRLVGLRLQVLEGELLELVLHLAHPETVGDRRVDVARLLRDLDAALLRQVVQRPHVVEPVGELDEDDADVVHHREQHLAEVLGLALLARGERNRAELGDPFDHVRDVGAEQLLDPLDRRLRVLDDVVQQPGRHRHDVELHFGEEIRDLERVDQVGLARMAHLSLVLVGRKDVGPPEQLDVGVGIGGTDLFYEVLEPDHESWCLKKGGRAVRPGDQNAYAGCG